MPVAFSLEFKVILFVIWSLACSAGGWYVEMLRWDSAEKGYVEHVVTVTKVIEKTNRAEVVALQKKNAVLSHANDNLKKEIAYATSQRPAGSFYDDRFIGVWDAKLAGRPFAVPDPAHGAAEKPGATGERATDAVLLANAARNGAKWAACRAQVEAIRSWAKNQFHIELPP